MKRISLIIIILSLTAILPSCDKLLDARPEDFYTPVNYYKNRQQLEAALAATYSKLGAQQLYGGRMTRMGLDADDGFYDRATDPIGVVSYDVPTTEPNVAAFWRTCYEGIQRANMLLANMDNAVDVTDAIKGNIRGEALFLRAFYYFLLVSNFGGVPLVLEPIDGNQISIPRTPVAEIYAAIVADMEEAEGLVRTATSVGAGGRINKSAVRGILARVNLFMAGHPLQDESRYAEARRWALAVIEDTQAAHELNPDFNQIFINYAADLYDIKESIWEIEFFGNTQGVFRESGILGTWNGIQYSAGDPRYGFSYGFLNTTGVLWERFENPGNLRSYDLRRDWSIAPFSLSGNPAVETPRPITQIYQRDAGKYRRFHEVLMPKEQNYTPINFPVLRYSDVLLMFAEAENHISGPTPQAIEAVNHVRRRGYGKYLNGIGGVAESIKEITITNGGSGYTVAGTTVVIQGGGGEEAAGRAGIIVSTGSIGSVVIDNPGKKFTSPPTILFQSATGSGATAVAELTQITDADLRPEQTASREIFLKTIQDERSRELCFESLRKGDLVRWGLLMENMKIVYNHILDASLPSNMSHAEWSYRNVSARDVVWPIPSYEMGMNSALIQNNGW